jgi:hypothetical protein
MKVIPEQLRHTSIAVTLERYSHLLLGIQDETVVQVERPLIR